MLSVVRRFVLPALILTMAVALPSRSDAAIISLTGNDGVGNYTYALTLAQNESVLLIVVDQIRLSGLSGVTNLALSSTIDSFFDSCGFTASTVCLQLDTSFQTFSGPANYGSFTVTSTVLTTGLVNFEIVTTPNGSSGQVTGPVAAPVPEPASLLLLGTGLLGAGARRWRQRRA